MLLCDILCFVQINKVFTRHIQNWKAFLQPRVKHHRQVKHNYYYFFLHPTTFFFLFKANPFHSNYKVAALLLPTLFVHQTILIFSRFLALQKFSFIYLWKFLAIIILNVEFSLWRKNGVPGYQLKSISIFAKKISICSFNIFVCFRLINNLSFP